MYSELECGICYRAYNAGLRCPRELRCKHSFCESCLLTLSRPREPDEARPGAAIVCPLCRHVTAVSGEGRKARAELPVDEGVLSRLLDAGLPERDEEEEEEEEEDQEESGDGQVQDDCGAEGSDSSAGSSGERVRCTLRKVWRKIIGKKAQRRGGENFMTKDDMRDFAMMACYMF